MKIGYLGPKGTFSYEVCKNYGQNNEMIAYKTIMDTIIALNNDEIDQAVVPIENSLQGCVTDTIDTLIEINSDEIKILKELVIEIKQNLMCKIDNEDMEINKIFSHTQALSQCKKYLENNYKNITIIPTESTAQAAKYVSDSKLDDKLACICNISCKEEYGLKVIEENIQDNRFNKTKFWVLSKEKNKNLNYRKMTVLFSVKDKPGALYHVLEIFNKYKLNLTKIESRPAKTVLGEYIFLIDIDIENMELNKNNAIKEIIDREIFIKILGEY